MTLTAHFAPRSNHLIAELLDHPCTSGITQDPQTMAYRVQADCSGCGIPRVTGGLFGRLRANFYPDRISAGAIKRKKGTSSRVSGIRIHRQVHHMVMCEKEGAKCDCTVKTNPKRLNKYTVALLDKFKELDIEPIATEVPIFCRKGGFCTRLDMLAMRSGIPLIISLKTGHSVGYNRDSRNTFLAAPFAHVKATTKNINQLQACSEHQILKREYGLSFKDYMIVYLGKKKDELVTFETPEKWWWATDTDTLDCFYRRLITPPATKQV